MALEVGGGARLLQKALDDRLIAGEVFSKHLHGAEAAVQAVAGQVNLGHAAAADALQDLILFANGVLNCLQRPARHSFPIVAAEKGGALNAAAPQILEASSHAGSARRSCASIG